MPKANLLVGGALAVGSLLLNSGCGPHNDPTPSKGDHLTTGSVRELDIVPVFPFRENFQVGDIYEDPLGPDAPDPKEALPIGVWVATLDMSRELEDFYQSRAEFPKTGTATTQASGELDKNPQTVVPQDTGDSNIFGGSKDDHRLRLVGFPAFSAQQTTVAGASAVIPTQVLALAAKGAFNANSVVSLSVPVAESYGLPGEIVMDKLMNRDDEYFHKLWYYLRRPDKNGKFKKVYVRVVTEVYYARAIDITIDAGSGGGFDFSAALTAKAVKGISGIQPTTQLSAPQAPSTTQPSATQPATSGTLVQDLNATLSETGGNPVPGAAVKFIAANSQHVALRRTFERPVAIGFRGFLVELSASDAEGIYKPAASSPSGSNSGSSPASKPNTPATSALAPTSKAAGK